MNSDPNTFPLRRLLVGIVAIALATLVFDRARAGGGNFYPPVSDPVVVEECGGCHMAFPAALLPARSWQAMMADLGNHFGEDASLDADTNARITRYLTDNAGDRGGQRYAGKLFRGLSASQAPLRITELPKWVKEHREVTPREWAAPEVKTKANCVACHRDAERGFFEDD